MKKVDSIINPIFKISTLFLLMLIMGMIVMYRKFSRPKLLEDCNPEELYLKKDKITGVDSRGNKCYCPTDTSEAEWISEGFLWKCVPT